MQKFAILLCFFSSVAHGQSYDFVGSMSPFSWNNGSRYVLDPMRSIDQESDDEETDQSSVQENSVYFISSKSRTRDNLSSFVSKIREYDSAAADDLERTFGSTDFVGQVGEMMETIGLESNNAAHAYAIYWISAWKASRGDVSTTDALAYQAVAAQIVNSFASAPAFVQSKDAEKQVLAEASMFQAALIDNQMQNAAGNPQRLNAIAKAVRQRTQADGLDLGKMTLTQNGFVAANVK